MEAFGHSAGHLYKTQWKTPLFCALFLHVIIFAGVFYAPEIFRTKPKFAKIQTVSLVNLAQPAASTKPAAIRKKQPPAKPTRPQKKAPQKRTATAKKTPVKTKSVAQKTVAASPADNTPPKAISVNPKKRKIKKQVVEPKKIDRKQERLKKERAQRKARELAQKLKQEAQLEKQALLAEIRAKLAQQALEEERNLFKKTSEIPDIPPAPEPPQQSAPTQSGQSPSADSSGIIGHQYYTTVGAIIQSHWVLPPNLENEADLQATLVIKINQSGQIIDMFFEKKSPNAMFNQFVTNSVNASNPLPPVPPALGLKEIEFEMFFSKEGVH